MATGRITNLQYSYYDVGKYLLDDAYGVSLANVNRSLLYLFNNDILLYSRVNSQFKGLWWKSWYDGKVETGYSAGDIVTSNGIDELTFIRRNWKSIKRIADRMDMDDTLPDFDRSDQFIVERYAGALAEYFYLGEKTLDQQLYVSLSDDNKAGPMNNTAWRPYLVTAYELGKKTYLLERAFQSAIDVHELVYHIGLDLLDASDSEYESNPESRKSIYDSELKSYLPKIGLDGEDGKWVEFAKSREGCELIALGSVADTAVRIVKPLGNELYWFESEVRSDGHVEMFGQVPLSLLEEVVPKKGTVEYNEWRDGGVRRYLMRLDFPINSSVSKMFYRKMPDMADELSGVGKRDSKRHFTSRGVGMRLLGGRDVDPDAFNLDGFKTILDGVQNVISSGTNMEYAASFPVEYDDWCPSKDMVVEDGHILPSKLESEFFSSLNMPFMINIDRLRQPFRIGSGYLLDPKYRKDATVAPVYHPSRVLEFIKADGSKDETSAAGIEFWSRWDLLMDMTGTDEELGPTRNIMLRLKVSETDLPDLLYQENPEFLSLAWYKEPISEGNPDGVKETMGQLLDRCEPRKVTFGTLELKDYSFEMTGPLDYMAMEDSEETVNVSFDPPKPGVNPDGSTFALPTPPAQTKTISVKKMVQKHLDAGRVVVNCQDFLSLEASVDFAEIPEDSKTLESMLDHIENTLTEELGMTDEELNRIYYIISYEEDSAVVLFYPKNCVDRNDGTRISFRDFAGMTDERRRAVLPEESYSTIDAESVGIVEKLFNDGTYECKESVDEDDTGDEGGMDSIAYIFTKVSERDIEEPEEEGPVDAPDNSKYTVAGRLRLIREFGTFKSPAMVKVLGFSARPALDTPIGPASAGCRMTVHPWNHVNGQVATISVPGSVNDVSISVSGVAGLDEFENLDGTVYGDEAEDAYASGESVDSEDIWDDIVDTLDRLGNASFDARSISLSWIRRIVRYRMSSDLLRCAYEFGAYDGFQLTLIGNVKPMMDRLWSVIAGHRFFASQLLIRNLSARAFDGLVTGVVFDARRVYSTLGGASGGIEGGAIKFKTVADAIVESYRGMWKRRKALFLYGGFARMHEFLSDSYYLGDDTALVKRILLRDFLRRNGRFGSIGTDFPDLKNLGERCVDALREVSSGILFSLHDMMSSLSAECSGVLDRLDSTVPEIDDTVRDGIVERLRHDFFSGDMTELSAYLKEISDVFQDMDHARDVLRDWLATEGLDVPTRTEVERRAEYLNDYHDRYLRQTLNFCTGYRFYIGAHMELLYGGKPYRGLSGDDLELYNDVAALLDARMDEMKHEGRWADGN